MPIELDLFLKCVARLQIQVKPTIDLIYVFWVLAFLGKEVMHILVALSIYLILGYNIKLSRFGEC